MSCSACGNSKVIARGLCGGCYHRLRRNGSVARKYVINTGKCSVDGCSRASFAKNLCQTHYTRFQHPTKNTWKLLRSRYPGEYPKSWDSFDKFVSDVGERPTPRHQLRRMNQAAPFAKDNVKWLEPVMQEGGMTKEERSVYSREWHLQRRYKITSKQFNALLLAQGGGCAICGAKETHIHRSGKVKDLSVDHCHKTGKVRGLLCVNCNRAIGYFGDDLDRMYRAIAYLRKE